MYQGKALPDDQGHNNLTQRMASSIAWANRAQAHPDTLAEILRPSLQHWADQPDASMDIEERLAEVSEQIAKAQVEYIEKRDKEAQATQDQLAEALGDAVPVADARFLICRSGTKNFYPFDFQRKEFCATPQQGYDGLYAFIRTNWTKANGCPVNHKKRSGEQIVDRAPRDYIRENSVQVKVMKKSFIEERSTVKGDERGVKLVLPAGERRFLTAEEAPDVHEWLMALSGDDPEVQRLFTLWIAALYRQEKRSCLLYISGAKNAGKSTFAQGVARMWDASPAKLGQVFERFNGDCENTPIWWADEKMAMPRGVDIAARIRELITLRDHKIERKGHEI
ncbi:MAG: hypothetical protein GY814_16875, partial [Gammaproteobacteria bacterium]|nr:hypothetical protein [Gammaproteobacteria bacterium]